MPVSGSLTRNWKDSTYICLLLVKIKPLHPDKKKKKDPNGFGQVSLLQDISENMCIFSICPIEPETWQHRGKRRWRKRKEKRKVTSGYRKKQCLPTNYCQEIPHLIPSRTTVQCVWLNTAPPHRYQRLAVPQVKPQLHGAHELNLRAMGKPILCSLLLDSDRTPDIFHFHRRSWRNKLSWR